MIPRLNGRLLPSILAGVLSLAAACAPVDRLKAPIDLTDFDQLRESNVSRLTLTRTGVITLGTAAETVGEIADFRVWRGNFYVLDGSSKQIRVFDARGTPVNVIGRRGSGPGEFQNPLSIAFAGDEMLVADLSAGNSLSRFDASGRFLGRTKAAIPGALSSVAAEGDLVATMGLLSISDPAAQGWNVMGTANARGDSLGSGCVIDARYVQSRKENGTLSRFGFGTVTTHNGEVYCTQGISPVVQVMDRGGRPVRQIRIAPPFYVAPADVEIDLNQKAIFRFLGSFTANAGYLAVQGGFVEMYTRYDEREQEIRYHLMICREGGSRRCGTVQHIRKPLHIPALDTLYLAEEIEPDSPVRIGVYHVAGLPD